MRPKFLETTKNSWNSRKLSKMDREFLMALTKKKKMKMKIELQQVQFNNTQINFEKFYFHYQLSGRFREGKGKIFLLKWKIFETLTFFTQVLRGWAKKKSSIVSKIFDPPPPLPWYFGSVPALDTSTQKV